SSLDSIPGVGPKKKRELIRKFGSPRGVKLASTDELLQVEGISPKLADSIFTHFEQDRAELLSKEQAKQAKLDAKKD
ncbi:MAG: excinuclease ABC subunit UvrC, partial [Planctomycetes bacterium]|nr:excinuclease ABC subunit UvrC [Planctomycetota bacterium]